MEEPYTSDRILCGDELRLAKDNDKPPKLRLFEGTWVPPKGITYFSIDDQIIEEMKAEGLIEERRPTEIVEVVAEDDPHSRFDEKAGLLNSKHWRRPAESGAPGGSGPVSGGAAATGADARKSDDHLRGSWGSLHEVRGTDDDAVGEVVDAAIEKAMSPPKNNDVY